MKSISLKIDDDILDRVDKIAISSDLDRSKVLRFLIKHGLENRMMHNNFSDIKSDILKVRMEQIWIQEILIEFLLSKVCQNKDDLNTLLNRAKKKAIDRKDEILERNEV